MRSIRISIQICDCKRMCTLQDVALPRPCVCVQWQVVMVRFAGEFQWLAKHRAVPAHKNSSECMCVPSCSNAQSLPASTPLPRTWRNVLPSCWVGRPGYNRGIEGFLFLKLLFKFYFVVIREIGTRAMCVCLVQRHIVRTARILQSWTYPGGVMFLNFSWLSGT